MPQPYFASPTDYALSAVNADVVLDAADHIWAQTPTSGSGTTPTVTGPLLCLVAGAASRPDLTASQARRIMRTSAASNLIVRHALVANLGFPHIEPGLEDVIDDALDARLLAQLVTSAAEHQADPDDGLASSSPVSFEPGSWAHLGLYVVERAPAATHYAQPLPPLTFYANVRRLLGEQALVANIGALPDHEAAIHPLLDEGNFARLATKVSTPQSDTDPLAEHTFSVLCQRDDLTEAQGMLLHEAATQRATGSREGRWVYTPLLRNPACPLPVLLKLVRHRARSVRDQVLTRPDLHPDVVFEAMRRHNPHAVLRLEAIGSGPTAQTGEIPTDAVAVTLADLADGSGGMSPQTIIRCLKAVLNFSPRESTWDQVLPIMRAVTEADDDAVQEFYRSAINARLGRPDWAAPTAPFQNRFLTWATAHEDAKVRAAAVAGLLLPEHLAIAATDESPLVRLAVSMHPHTPWETIRALADDPDKTVRRLVGEKFLVALHG